MENDYIMVEVEPNKYKKIKSTQITADDFEYTKGSIAEAPFGKRLIEILNKTEEKFKMKKGERSLKMEKIYKIKVIFIDGKEKIEIAAAEDELGAIDQVIKKYEKEKNETIEDIKII